MLIQGNARAHLTFVHVCCRGESGLNGACARWLLGVGTAVVRSDRGVEVFCECGPVTHAIRCVDALTWGLVTLRARNVICDGAGLLVMIGCWPKLAHLVLVTQTPPCSPPLHSIAVVDERQLWPGGAVVPVWKVSVGNPLPPLPPLPVLVPVAPLPLPLSLPAVVVGLGAGVSKSGGVPVGVGMQ